MSALLFPNEASLWGSGLNNATYDSKSLSVSAQDTTPQAIAFSSDGTKMYMLGSTSNTIYQYTLSTAWDVSTGTYASKSYLATGQDTAPRDFAFNTAGSKLFILGTTNDVAYQYTLSTPWDISTASYDTVSFSFTSQSTAGVKFCFAENGARMYLNTGGGIAYQYALSTPFVLSSASYATKTVTVTQFGNNPTALRVSNDGMYAYWLAAGQLTLSQHRLTTAYDITTFKTAGTFLNLTAVLASPTAFFVQPDGNKVYVVTSTTTDVVYQYSVV